MKYWRLLREWRACDTGLAVERWVVWLATFRPLGEGGG